MTPARGPALPAACIMALWISLASAQQSIASIPVAAQSYRAAAILPGWPSGIYLLDTDQSEVLMTDAAGSVQARYGGWGGGAQGLDYPVDLLASENSIWILDQGTSSIVRLDQRLNLVMVLVLPEGSFPLAFARDRQQRFWVARESEPGLQLINDSGDLLLSIGDGKAGTPLIQRPTQLASFSGGMLVWDALPKKLVRVTPSGHISSRQAVDIPGEVLDLIAAGEVVWLLTSKALWRLTDSLLVLHSENIGGWVALVERDHQAWALGKNGLEAITASH